MSHLRRFFGVLLAAGASVLIVGATPAMADSYSVSYSDGGSWNDIYGQGFSTSLGATPAPSASAGDTIDLTTSDPTFVGLSSNSLAGTASVSTGSPLTFNFSNLPLIYGNDYSAIFVTVGSGGTLTPALVPVLTTNYTLQGDGNYHPATNYGTESQYQYVTTNFIQSNGYFSAFNYAGDADFSASLSTVPEPGTLGILGLVTLLGLRRRAR